MKAIRTWAEASRANTSPDAAVALGGRVALSALANFAELGFPIISLDEAGGPVYVAESPADLTPQALESIGFSRESLLETAPEVVSPDAGARAWVVQYVFTNDGGPTLVIPEAVAEAAAVTGWLHREASR